MVGQDGLGSVRTPRTIMRFAVPSIVMMVFISSYSVVDGIFISNFLGTDSLAALNITAPAFNAIGAIGFMFATGGSAYVATLMGKGRREEADRSMFQIFVVTIFLGIVLTALGILFAEPVLRLLGADDDLLPIALDYWYVLAPFTSLIMVEFVGQQFLVAAGKPRRALAASVANGCTNIALDWLFMGPFGWGMHGAALASGLGSVIVAAVVFWTLTRDGSLLRFERSRVTASVIVPTCTNGVSELASNLSAAITVLLYNLEMMKYLGADGVSAISIISYVEFLAVAAIGGYSMGVAPVMSFFNGARDTEGMHTLYRFSMTFVAAFSVSVFVVMELFAGVVVGVFAGDSDHVRDIATDGARIYSFAFLFMGFNIYASSLFTSLSNGVVSAIIAGIRGIILLAPLIVILPEVFGIDAIWYAVTVTEVCTLALSVYYMLRLGPRYGFLARHTRATRSPWMSGCFWGSSRNRVGTGLGADK